MFWNIYFTLRGSARTMEVPNKSNPVKSEHLASLLGYLSQNLPSNPNFGLETIGVRVELAEEITVEVPS